MTTITAKELREHLSEYLDKAQAGEEIAIVRHSKITARLVSINPITSNRLKILNEIKRYHNYVRAAGLVLDPDPSKSAKELYYDALQNDPKYSHYFTKPKKDHEKNIH